MIKIDALYTPDHVIARLKAKEDMDFKKPQEVFIKPTKRGPGRPKKGGCKKGQTKETAHKMPESLTSFRKYNPKGSCDEYFEHIMQSIKDSKESELLKPIPILQLKKN